MEPVVIVRGDCGGAIRMRRHQVFHVLMWLRAPILLLLAWIAWDARGPGGVRAQVVGRTDGPSPPALAANRPQAVQRNALSPNNPAPTSSKPSAAEDSSPITSVRPEARQGRFRIRDDFGRCVVARMHGQIDDKTVLVQPDGQLGFPTKLVPTDEPFQPLTRGELRTLMQNGPFAGYQVHETPHYLIFYQSTRTFAEDSGRLLEDLYRGLLEVFRKHEVPVYEAEFPLVAVIFATERDFREHKRVDPEVQAYYELFTNRIFFYQSSEHDEHEPKLSALRKPQTVAHEGAHQVLSNIGVQPRLSAWPLWLIEGLAEYCSTPGSTKKGIVWERMGMINSLHMATLRELADPLSNQVNGPAARTTRTVGTSRTSRAESLIVSTHLTPTDYAEAWAMTHYLAQKRAGDFVPYLKALGQLPPLQLRTPQDHLAEFRKYFGQDLAKLDRKVDDHIRQLSRKKGYDPLPYYAVMFAQPLGGGMVRRAVTVSQSPQVIQDWVQQKTAPQGDVPAWEASPYPTRAQAQFAAERWWRGD